MSGQTVWDLQSSLDYEHLNGHVLFFTLAKKFYQKGLKKFKKEIM